MRKISLYLIYMYFLICPLEFVFNAFLGSSVKYIAIVTAGMVAMFFIGNYNQKVRIGAVQICLILWAIMQATSILWTIYYTNTTTRLTTYLMMDVLVIMLSIFPFDTKEFKTVLWSYALGCFILAVLLITTGKMDEGYNYEGRLTINILNSYLDPNNLAAILLSGIFTCFSSIWKKTKASPVTNIFGIAAFIVMVIGVMLTGSRGGIIALVVGLAVYIYAKANKKTRPIVIICFLVGVVVAFILAKAFLPAELSNRLFAFDEYGGGSGRLDHWIAAVKKLCENPLFGFGVASYFGYFNSLQGVEFAMHNTFLAVLFEIGLIGLIVFMIPIILGIKSTVKTKSPLLLAIIFSNMAAAFFLDTLHTRFFWNAIALVVIWHEIQIRQQKELPSEEKEEGIQVEKRRRRLHFRKKNY